MVKEYSRSRGRMRRASSTRRDDLADWRHLTRPVILENFLNRTHDLRWSRELIDLLLDEPLAGMGPEESERMTALLKGLAREHAVLLIEHDMDFVFAVADWMTVMAPSRAQMAR